MGYAHAEELHNALRQARENQEAIPAVSNRLKPADWRWQFQLWCRVNRDRATGEGLLLRFTDQGEGGPVDGVGVFRFG